MSSTSSAPSLSSSSPFSAASTMQMPRILYGTAWKKARTADLVEAALLKGYRGLDTAGQPKHYNEAGVGAGIARAMEKGGIPREHLFVQTKFSPISAQDTSQPMPYDPQAPLEEQVAQSFQSSQKNLGTHYVDSLVLHSPLADFTSLLCVWSAMEKIHQTGGARTIGVSNCYDLALLQQLHSRASVKPSVVQNRLYAQTGYDRELREWCRQQGIAYQSFWTLSANPHLLRSPTLTALSHRYQKTPEQVFFRALIQLGVTPLTGTTSEQHMQDDLDVLNFELQQEEVQQVDQLLKA